MSNLESHEKSDRIKWIITFIILVALAIAVVGLSIKLASRTEPKTVSADSYIVGTIDNNGETADGDSSILLRDSITVDGFNVRIGKESKVTYKLFFYDGEDKLVLATENLETDFDGSTIPIAAKKVKVMITPTEDADGKVSLAEVEEYAKQITVTYNK